MPRTYYLETIDGDQIKIDKEGYEEIKHYVNKKAKLPKRCYQDDKTYDYFHVARKGAGCKRSLHCLGWPPVAIVSVILVVGGAALLPVGVGFVVLPAGIFTWKKYKHLGKTLQEDHKFLIEDTAGFVTKIVMKVERWQKKDD